MSIHHIKLSLIVLMAVGAYPASCLAEDEAPKADETFFIQRTATYKDSGQISGNAKEECGLETSIPAAVEKFAPKYKIKAALIEADKPEDKPQEKPAEGKPGKTVSLEIHNITAGKAGSGFGGRWVVSEIGVTASLITGQAEPVKKYFSCSAGLGANPFANFKACDRLERCAEQIGAKTAKWLSTLASEKP